MKKRNGNMEKRDIVISMKTTKTIKEKLKKIATAGDRSVSSQIERFLKQGITEWELKNPGGGTTSARKTRSSGF